MPKTKAREDFMIIGHLNVSNKFEIAGTEVTASADELNALDGLTASVAELNILDGVTKTAAQLNKAPEGVAAGYKVARGQHTTVDENDTVVTGLATVVSVVVSLDDDPVDGCQFVTGSIGDQAGAPAAGSVLIKTWKAVDGDASLVAATTFSKKVNWIAIGT
jgi:hypothetical protein